MFVADTNVLIYAVDEDAPEHQRCTGLLHRWRAQPGAWFLTWGICYEFLRVITHRRVLRNPRSAEEAMAILHAILASPGVEVLTPTDRHADVLSLVTQEVPALSGNLWYDVETATLMREHGVRRICTRDTDFHRFRFLECIDPLVGEP